MFPLHEPVSSTHRDALSAYDDLTASLLVRRGITTDAEAKKFLEPSYDRELHDPLTMIDMGRAARRLADAISSNESIAVWSDYDCDGIPGAVLFHDFLARVGARFRNYIPHRHLEGYGVQKLGIDRLHADGVTLIVTIDSGITDSGAIAHANELGMDIIVTDHHLPSSDGLPPAYAVVNPNARENETYPFRSLCGAGVAWKLVCATLAVAPTLRERMPEGSEKWLLDMVGIATIADMVPLIGENRMLATYGLLVLRKSPRLGLQKLCRTIRVNQRLMTEDDIGFMLAPRINAASRIGDARDAFTLLTTTDETIADEYAKKLERANRTRKAEVGAITRVVHERLRARTDVPSVIAIGDPGWRPSLLGPVASTIAEEYDRPVFLWGREGNDSIKGSVRSGGNVHIVELMQATENIFEAFGGHTVAGGFTVKKTEIFFLEERLVAAREKITANESDELETRADALLSLDEVTPTLLKRLERLAPFGVGNPKPAFLLREVNVDSVSRFGKNQEHVRLALSADQNVSVSAIAFFARGALTRTLETLDAPSRVSLLAHIERDSFSRAQPVRLRLLDLRVVRTV